MIFLVSCCYILHWQCMENCFAREFLLQTWRSKRVVKVANNLKNGHVHVLNGTYYCPEKVKRIQFIITIRDKFFWIAISLQIITIFKTLSHWTILNTHFYDNSNSYRELYLTIISRKSTVAYSKRYSLWYVCFYVVSFLLMVVGWNIFTRYFLSQKCIVLFSSKARYKRRFL